MKPCNIETLQHFTSLLLTESVRWWVSWSVDL